MNLIKDMKGNRKSFYEYARSNREDLGECEDPADKNRESDNMSCGIG